MKYLPTAFGQLAFAWKLYNYGLKGKINAEELDADVTWRDEGNFFVVPRALGSADDLIIALENNLVIAFGAAAITLNRVREEMDIPLPDAAGPSMWRPSKGLSRTCCLMKQA